MRFRVPVLLCLPALFALNGCVSTKTSPIEDTSQFRSKTVVLTARPRAAFMAATTGKAMFGVVGAVATEESGKAIVTENAIDDPAKTVGSNLLAAAEKRYGVVAAPMQSVVIDTTDVSQLARAAKGADLLLDVQSYGQGFMCFPTDWSHYWVRTIINVRLIDVPRARLIAEGHCDVDTRKDPNPPTRSEMLEGNATRLKVILDAQSSHCAAKFRTEVLKIAE
jgi:hypothetical protein